MIKKILSLTFAILMAVSIVSCGAEEKTAYELVTEGQEKVQTLDSLDYDLDLDMGIGVLGITYNLPVTAKISISGAQSETPEMYITAGFEYMGVTVTLDAYYDSEYVYISGMGMQNKFNIAEAIAEAEKEADSSEIPDFTDEYYEILKTTLAETEVIKNKDGTKIVSYTISSEQMLELMTKVMEAVDGEYNMAEDLANYEIKVSDLTITNTIDANGYITDTDCSIEITLIGDLGEDGAMYGMNSIEMTLTLDGNITLNNPGEPVEVTPMEGYESFEEYTEDSITIPM